MIRKHVASVQNYKSTIGTIGQKEYSEADGAPISVPCNRYALGADEVKDLGLQMIETKKLFCDSWPGDSHSVITIEGQKWAQVGPTQTFDNTSIRNVVVIIEKRE